MFDEHIFLQLRGAAVGARCALSYSCFIVGYSDETKLTEEIEYFNEDQCKLIVETLKHYDGFIFSPVILNFEIIHFLLLNSVLKKRKLYQNGIKVQVPIC